ncbi:MULTISPECIES: tyrosine-type recombinase/integrase [Phytobacter]|uniref:Integrase n=1 Tax=Phytobacter diazotrophicus TaxID=395631 RepID=A0ABN6LP30_9ENTR|nr:MULTISPECIES: site-specific integrase [Phytobacter]BBE77555.1 integrase [Phytobacter sp. MRY16-398]BDD50926.1 integrase [Phytobacter diazotrophicus]BEG81956.1 site-specific integrase [Phytobacter diazotrophicus]BEG87758.1 site-specific integrase [Phytobacter diazotrophicus]BEG93551.1 site-specific integrase [Phytobacter diazotrophicus]
MSKTSYPTGVENHGGSLRIWFNFNGRRIRENLGVPDNAKNRKVAGDLRTSVCFAIRMGSFNYAAQFPNSPNLKLLGLEKKEITVKVLAEKWLELKKMEISANALSRYQSVVRNMVPRIGGNRMVSAVSREDLLFIRKDLLTGQHSPGRGKNPVITGRAVPTVNYYMTTMSGMFQFAADNGYASVNPFDGITPLKKSKAEPDPLNRDEFLRLIEACHHQQIKNLWSLAVYTGVRHGELVALAWEDIDLRAGTMTVRRNHTSQGDFTLPKTDAGTDRVIHLIQPAIDTLKNQAEMTRLGRQYQIEVKLREYGRSTMHPCTFIFNPQVTRKNSYAGHHYSVRSVSSIWETVTKRAGIRYRKAYQSRHTYACWSLSAGANPTFIASQMGHSSAQMVYSVYGAWMAENSAEQVSLLNQKLSAYAPSMPQKAHGGT